MNHLVSIFECYIYLKKNDRNEQNVFSLRAFIRNIKSIDCHIASRNGNWNTIIKNGQS